MPAIPADYRRRNDHLEKLGFDSYSHYLNSEMWTSIRQMVLTRDGGKCRVCGRAAVNVHHNSYEVDVLIGRDLSQLVSLCRKHHEEAEFGPGGKRELPEVRESLKAKGLPVPPLIKKPLHRTFSPPRFNPTEGMSPRKIERQRLHCQRIREQEAAVRRARTG
jgi:hypothetical protein